jgi:hypothetical protein
MAVESRSRRKDSSGVSRCSQPISLVALAPRIPPAVSLRIEREKAGGWRKLLKDSAIVWTKEGRYRKV